MLWYTNGYLDQFYTTAIPYAISFVWKEKKTVWNFFLFAFASTCHLSFSCVIVVLCLKYSGPLRHSMYNTLISISFSSWFIQNWLPFLWLSINHLTKCVLCRREEKAEHIKTYRYVLSSIKTIRYLYCGLRFLQILCEIFVHARNYVLWHKNKEQSEFS